MVPTLQGKHEPLCALYNVSCLKSFAEQLRHGNLRIYDAYKMFKLCQPSEKELVKFDEDLKSFVNINYPTDIF